MSLWYESLGQSLYDCEEDGEQRAKCILEHLSMDVLVFGGSVPWQAAEKLRLRPPFSVARLSPVLTYA